MSLASLLTKLTNARGAIVAALGSKGVELASSASLHDCASAIQSITVSSGADVTLGYVSSGVFYELGFIGTTPFEVASSSGLSAYGWNIPASGSSSGGSSGMVISSGQVFELTSSLSAITVDSGGSLSITSGGLALGLTVNSDGAVIAAGGGMSGVTNSGAILIGEGSIASGVTNYGSGIKLIVNLYGSASGIIISGGIMTVDGTATDITVHSGGILNIDKFFNISSSLTSGHVSGVTIESGGTMSVFSGGTALAVTSQAGAVVISSGGYIEYVSSSNE